ncbi:hypothetical protein THRCLA_22984 [Thraustotheca clavata]|uniref:Uncharacterized protein n=1 Tax=Thraustotheca clavata TaxID=74557 RepID=A0A1V9YJZ9_9STRA|nr:hypothetical protein THRCLA_22984 [Thraustotheca clavata]
MSHEYMPIDDSKRVVHEEIDSSLSGRVPRKLGQIGMVTLVMGIGLFLLGAVNLNESTQPPAIATVEMDQQVEPTMGNPSNNSIQDATLVLKFPFDSSFHHYTLSADDEGFGYLSSDGRSFRSDHSNLFGRGVTGKIVSVDDNSFLIRSNGECCRFMESGDEILLKPPSFDNYRAAGNADFDTGTATLWVDSKEASIFWMDRTGLPLRWDYIPKSPLGKRISVGKMISMVYTNFTIGYQPAQLFDVPASCTTAQRCRFD